MATIADAIKSGRLAPYLLPEWERRSPIRNLYVRPEFFDWADSNAALMDMKLGKGGRDRLEHLEQLFCDFRCSQRPGAGDLKRMMPTSDGVWKMHPYGLRIYGWFPEKGTFAVVTGALVEDTKSTKGLNDQKLDEVLSFISQNKLTGHVILGDINAVL